MLAAAQRRVRAEFVFMLGGELEEAEPRRRRSGLTTPVTPPTPTRITTMARPTPMPSVGFDDGTARTAEELHEEAHARADADAAEGRLAQAGRIELSRAIQAMSQAVNHLNAVDLEAALAAEAARARIPAARLLQFALPPAGPSTNGRNWTPLDA
jgi:hypothetical protein